MNLIKCEKGHYYDKDKFAECPQCSQEAANVQIENLAGIGEEDIDTDNPASAEIAAAVAPAKLKGKTVGWLCCINGAMKGESFILREGKNDIGRSANMDVRLSKEPTVSRERHASITYDGTKNLFLLETEKNREDVICNQEIVITAIRLSAMDRICLGDCELIFVPLCGAQFSWD